MNEIYLDNASTTRVKPKVVKVMRKVLLENYGNPSSQHRMGEESLKLIHGSRKKFAKELGAKPQEIFFTSGGTESNNLAIQGLARANLKKRKIIISSIEHPSIIETCKFMKSQGYEIVEIPVDSKGLLNIEKLKNEINRDTLVVSIIHVNNVFGTIQNLREIGKICKQKKVYFHTDAVQSFGKLRMNVKNLNLDLLSASGHKIGGPKGIGILYIRDGTNIEPILFGGGQEKNIRNGTENSSGIMGFEKSLELINKINKGKILKLRNKFIENLEKLGGIINGSKEKRIFNNVHVSFRRINSERLVHYLSENRIYSSVGSACDSKKKLENKILKNIGLNKELIGGSIRFSLNENITKRDIEKVTNKIKKFLRKN